MLQPPGAATGRRAAPTNRRKTQESPDDVLRQLQRLAPNKKCADCNTLAPQCANLTIGSFVCITCSGILREINHRVKGIGHSSFTVEEADRMKQSNNEEINKVYLARFNPAHEHLKQPQGNSDQQLLRAWIRRKYHDKAWYKDGLNNAQPTVVKIPPKEAAPAVDLLGSYGNSPTPATNNESSWNAFGGSSQSQQQQQAPAFKASFPANFPSPQSPTSAFPSNFGSSQTLQAQQQQPPPQQQQQSNFASFPAPSQNQQQPGFANFSQGVGAPDPSQQQSFANFNQAQTAQPQFPNQQQQPQQQPQFANFNQQPPNAAQQHVQPGQQQQPPQQGPQGFASFNQPVQVFHVQQQAPDPFAQQGFGKVNPQYIQQAMFQGQQQPQNVNHPVQLQQSHSMPLPQQNQQQQQFAQQQQQIHGQVNQQQQPQPQGVNAGNNTQLQQGGVQQGGPGAGFASQASFPGAALQQNPAPQQPAANDGSVSKEGSSSIGKSKYSAGQLVIYKSASEVCSAKIAKVHFDDALDPFYTVVLENGKEKQTDDAHLDAQETLQSEINEILPSLTPVQLKQLHEFLTQLKGISKPPASNGSSVSNGVQAPTFGSEQPNNSAPSGAHSSPSRSATPVPSGQPVAPSPAPSVAQQQDSASFIPSPTPPSKPPTHPQNTQGSVPPQGQYQSGAPAQSMQGMPPNAGPPQGQFQANYPGQAPQGVPPQGMMQPNQQGLQGIQPGFAQSSSGFAPNPGVPNNNFGQQPAAPPQQQGGSSFIPSPPSMNNAVNIHPSGLPAPPLVPPPSMQQQPQQYQQQQFQQMQQQFQQMQPPQQQFQQMQPPPQQQFQQMQPPPQQQFQQMQPPPQQQFQQQNIPQPVAGTQPPNGEPASPMSPKGNPFDFY